MAADTLLDFTGGATLVSDGPIIGTDEPALRILSIELSTMTPDVADEVFQREIGDKIAILRTPPGGGARITQQVWIQKIEISGTNDGTPLSVKWAVSPL
jgi:hypothetical protein